MQALAQALARAGVRQMFGLPGGGSSLDLIEAAAEVGIGFTLSKTENAAVMMAGAFGSFEGIHTIGYAFLNDTLGLKDYDAFLAEPTAKAKIDRLVDINAKEASREDIAKSLAVFSGFVEGVSLFSSFAILFNFSRFNKLKGVGQIISWSVRDESLHSQAGCWLFREYIKENHFEWHPSQW